MTKDVLNVTTKFMNDPIKIFVKKEELTLAGIRQFYIDLPEEVSIFDSHESFLYRLHLA